MAPAKTSTKPKPKATPKAAAAPVDPERLCPACGQLHGSSFVPEAEAGQLEGVKLSALPKAAVYRVFYCGGAFHVVPQEEV